MAGTETLSAQTPPTPCLETPPNSEAHDYPVPAPIPVSFWEAARERKRQRRMEAAAPQRKSLLHHKGDLVRHAFHLSRTSLPVVVRFTDDEKPYAGTVTGLEDPALHLSQSAVINRVLFKGLPDAEVQAASGALPPPASKDIQMVDTIWTGRELREALSDCIFGKSDPELTNPPLFVTI